jgi:hypothetical protein
METKRMDPKKQFSKRLARWTAVFWFAYLIWLSILMMLEPSVGQFVFYISIEVSVVMMINVISYSINSITEKRIFGMLDKAQIELKFGPARIAIGDKDKGGDDDEMTEEGGNG